MAGLRMLETNGGGPMDPTAKSHIYDYFQAMFYFSIFYFIKDDKC